jgi:hypothetical protein
MKRKSFATETVVVDKIGQQEKSMPMQRRLARSGSSLAAPRHPPKVVA